MILSDMPTNGDEVVRDLSYEETLKFVAAQKISKIDPIGETVYIETPEGFLEVLCETPEEAESMILDARLAAWDDKLVLKTGNLFRYDPLFNNHKFEVGMPVRFLPHNQIQIGSLAGKVMDFQSSGPTPEIEVSLGKDHRVWLTSYLEVDLKKFLLDKKILGIFGMSAFSTQDTRLRIGITSLHIETEDGIVVLWHDQVCCENASLFDFEGDEEDLVGATVRRVIVGEDKEGNPFYDIRTTNGDLWLRFGNGNDTAYSLAMLVGFRSNYWPFSQKNPR